MNKPEYIIVHHSLVSYDKNPDQFDAIKRFHISKGYGDIGYHYTISKDGTIHNGREESEVGAHCKQEGMNARSIGIMLDGDFDHQSPTISQLASLTYLITDIKKRYTIKEVKAHRWLATYKTCPGSRFTDLMVKELTNLLMSRYVDLMNKEVPKGDQVLTSCTGDMPLPESEIKALLNIAVHRAVKKYGLTK